MKTMTESIVTAISYSQSYQEYSVFLWVNGEIQHDLTYFTDDHKDAVITAKQMILNYKANN